MSNPLTPLANVIRDRYGKERTFDIITRAIGGDADFISRGQYDHLAGLDNHASMFEDGPICKENFIAANGESIERALSEYLADGWVKLVDGISSLDMLEQFKDSPRIGELREGIHDKLLMAKNVIELSVANYRTIFGANDNGELGKFLSDVEREVLTPLTTFLTENGIEALSPNADYSTFDFFEGIIDQDEWDKLASVNRFIRPVPEGQ